ncbi:MAG: ABC transporter ATP-binding protein [Spirochaetaceae bacterium]|jgi:ATP-binding cassette subfamily B protein|nr:ABC transporter ATP-binding protein [Spirochaetaceae bacterium]
MRNNKNTLKSLITMIGPSRLIFMGAMTALAVAVAMETLGNLLIRHIIDEVLIKDQGFRSLLLSGFAFLGLALTRGLFFFLEGKGKAKTAENVVKGLRGKIYDHIQRLSFVYHDKTNSGELVQRATSDVDSIRRFYMDQVPELLKILLLYVINLTALLILEWRLALWATIATPLMVFLSWFFFGKIFETYDDYQNQEALMTTRIQENLSGIRVVRAFARQNWEKKIFKGINDEQRRLGFRHIFWHNLYWPFAHIICGTQFVTVLVIGAIMVIKEQISPGTYVAFASMVNSLIWPLQELGRVITELSKSYVSFQRVEEILQEEQEPLKGIHRPNRIQGNLEFKELHFFYNPGTPVLKGINLKVKQGEKIALLGSTGSGKTTLVNLLPRFYDYQQGEILLDGVSLHQYSRKELRNNMGIVEQEPFLFSMTVAENIAYSVDRDVTPEEIEAAARAAAIHDSIMSFPMGYDTQVGEKGVSLSGGQKQRITIARTLLKNPRILILDDSTSAVDADTEEQIRRALDGLMENRTTFIIAHRIQTLQMADRVVVLNHGKICQMGTHEQLVKEQGFYREVFDLQTKIEVELQEELAKVSNL